MFYNNIHMLNNCRIQGDMHVANIYVLSNDITIFHVEALFVLKISILLSIFLDIQFNKM